jgi:hypothetical protein
MAEFKLMTNDEYKKYIINGTLISNMNKGVFGTPIYLKGKTVQSLVQPVMNLDNPMYYHPNQQNTFVANNTLAQSNYANPRRMK